ncbi:hypothetical protein SLOPH_1134 [Spraguea lophii 42_110]|uniref:Uncharacterized protein n=1 Tax=Spraguea lophii (strain 42_110) TaxID=1358809 RepID=S7XHF4_SPRLO|nr:hypothetical protein SLOPH_1134 [Spraguea lophii 42_110]
MITNLTESFLILRSSTNELYISETTVYYTLNNYYKTLHSNNINNMIYMLSEGHKNHNIHTIHNNCDNMCNIIDVIVNNIRKQIRIKILEYYKKKRVMLNNHVLKEQLQLLKSDYYNALKVRNIDNRFILIENINMIRNEIKKYKQ